jgi:hypothetical protein
MADTQLARDSRTLRAAIAQLALHVVPLVGE